MNLIIKRRGLFSTDFRLKTKILLNLHDIMMTYFKMILKHNRKQHYGSTYRDNIGCDTTTQERKHSETCKINNYT